MNLLFFISLIILLVSCESSENSLTFNSDYKNLYTAVNPSNPNNPYDSIGNYHNLALDYIIQNYTENGCDSSDHYNALKGLIIDFENNIHQQIPSNYVEDSINNIFDEFFGEDIFLTSSQIIEKYNIPQNVHNKFSELIYIAQLLDSNYTLQEVIDSLKSVESMWINDQTLTSNNKMLLFRSSSILRYSLVYWSDVINNQSHKWHGAFIACNKANKLSDELLGLPGYTTTQELIAIGISDAIGGYTLGLFGGITSSTATAIYIYWDEVSSFFEDAWDWLTDWF